MNDTIAKYPPLLVETIDTNAWTAPFWEATARHELAIPRCRDCGKFRMPPTPFCPGCQSQAIDWVAISNNGVVYSFTLVTRSIVPGMEDSLPYVPAIIELPEAGGVRLITNIVDSPLDEISVGAPCCLVWHDTVNGYTLPLYRLSP